MNLKEKSSVNQPHQGCWNSPSAVLQERNENICYKDQLAKWQLMLTNGTQRGTSVSLSVFCAPLVLEVGSQIWSMCYRLFFSFLFPPTALGEHKQQGYGWLAPDYCCKCCAECLLICHFTGSHSLWILSTFIIGETPFPEFNLVLILDDITVGHYDLKQHDFVPIRYRDFNDTRGPIDRSVANLIFGNIHKNMKSHAIFLKGHFNHTEGRAITLL